MTPPPDPAAVPPSTRVGIRVPADVGIASQAVRRVARTLNFPVPDQAMLMTATSELATNIVRYAERGWCVIEPVERARRNAAPRVGLQVVFGDYGPGIPDIEAAMRDGHSSIDSLGLGLPGVKRLMDELQVESEPGRGTRIVIRKFLP